MGLGAVCSVADTVTMSSPPWETFYENVTMVVGVLFEVKIRIVSFRQRTMFGVFERRVGDTIIEI